MEELVRKAQNLGITLAPEQVERFSQLLTELKAWNSHTNLTAIRDDAGIITKHFIDSLTILQAIPSQAKTLIDIGTGAGFPGLPIAIVRPEITVTLVESVGKKTKFIEHVAATLKLSNIRVFNTRAEELALQKDFRELFDVATARAVAELRTLVEYVLPFVNVGGIFIAQKTANTPELQDAEHALHSLGGKLQKVIDIDALENRQLIVIEKVAKTPSEFPRNASVISKKPL